MTETVAFTMDGGDVVRPALPFDLSHWTHHIPEIEKRIRDLKPHVIVCGLGPSAYLLNHLDQSLLANVRLWGVNDFWKIRPCDDLTLMDPPGPGGELRPGSERHNWVLKAKPSRWWIYNHCDERWKKILPQATDVRVFDLKLWLPGQPPPGGPGSNPVPRLQDYPVNHTIASPVGTIAMAWRDGCRRIGFIGVDLLQGHHRLSQHAKWIKWFIKHFSHQARALDGAIVNLAPFSAAGSHPVEPEKKP